MTHSPLDSVPMELLRTYDVPCPRYTSYPTALQFDEIEAEKLWRRSVCSGESDEPISLYFHIPFCQKLCWYCACNRVVSKNRTDGARYLDVLFEEMERTFPAIGGHEVSQIHLGGGTPTFLPPDQLRQLGEFLHDHFDIRDDAELAIEIDPRSCNRGHLEALETIGFTRASLGIQSTDPKVQRAINREQPHERNRQVVSGLREAGIESINVDLIYGLPHQTLDRLESTLDDVLELEPDRLATYSYAHVPWAHPAQKLLDDDALPDAETKLQLFQRTVERMGEAGYEYIGLDHFARPDDGLAEARREGTLRRNFQGYSTRAGADVHAFGMTAISQFEDAYFQNVKELDDYRSAVDDGELPVARGYILSRDDQIRRRVIERIMCRGGLEFDALAETFDIEPEQYLADALERLAPFERNGLVERASMGVEITPMGRLFLRNITSCFDAHLDRDDDRYSKAV